MKGLLRTSKKLSSAKDKSEYYSLLKTTEVIDFNKGNYTDIGFCILKLVLENKLKEPFDVIMDKYLLKRYDLTNTMFNPPLTFKVLGNGNDKRTCHDFKSRIIDSINASAGLFVSLDDSDKFLDNVLNYKIFDKEFIEEINNYYFIDSKMRKRSYAGLYLKSNCDSYVPKYYSDLTISHQGFTGSVVVVDFKNRFYNSILVDALKDNALKKDEKFLNEFKKIQDVISLYTILLYLIN